MTGIEMFGFLSAGLLAICGVPQAWHTYKVGHGAGISKMFIWLWLLGEIGTIFYTAIALGFIAPLMMNYFINIVIIGIIMKYIYFPRH